MMKYRKYIYFSVLLSALILTACKKSVSPAEYVKYVEQPGKGLHIQKQFNGVEYSLQYEPTEYCVMLEKHSLSVPRDVFKEEYKRFKGLEHYTLRIDRAGMDSLVNKLGDTSKYKKSITEYFDFKIQKDIKLVKGQDTIPCSICQCDANTGNSRYYAFSLGFYSKNNREESSADDRVIEFENKNLHTGKVNLVVSGNDIMDIPALKMM
jgi:hypothetical protein